MKTTNKPKSSLALSVICCCSSFDEMATNVQILTNEINNSSVCVITAQQLSHETDI